MKYTEKLEMKLPEDADRFDIDDFNENFEKLDNAFVGDEDGDLNTDGGGVYLYKDTAANHSRTSGMSADSEGNLTIGRSMLAKYDPGKVSEAKFYEEENEDTGQIEQIAKVEANHRVILQAGRGVLEVTEEGVTFNGKSLGGSSQPIGQPIGILSGTARSVVGIFLSAWSYAQEDNDDFKTTSTVTVTARENCLLIACAMFRGSTISISGDGWTAVNDPANIKALGQSIAIWKKQVSAGTHTITVTQNSSVRMSLKAVCLYDVTNVNVAEETVISSMPYTPNVPSSGKKLYLVSSVYADSVSTSVNAIAATGGVSLSAEEQRFSAFYDEDEQAALSFTYYQSGGYTANTANIITLSVT